MVNRKRFTEEDRRKAEERYGKKYAITGDARMLIPFTHAGPGKVACVSPDRPSPYGYLINWQIWDIRTGERILHGHERNHAQNKDGWKNAMERALRWVTNNGCFKVASSSA